MVTHILRNVRLTRLRLGLVVLLGLFVLGGATAQSVPAGTLRVGMESPSKLDPAYASSDAEVAILNAVYDYLVDVDAENNIQPRLASSWKVSQDGLTYTFTMRDAKFSDGSPVTVEEWQRRAQ